MSQETVNALRDLRDQQTYLSANRSALSVEVAYCALIGQSLREKKAGGSGYDSVVRPDDPSTPNYDGVTRERIDENAVKYIGEPISSVSTDEIDADIAKIMGQIRRVIANQMQFDSELDSIKGQISFLSGLQQAEADAAQEGT